CCTVQFGGGGGEPLRVKSSRLGEPVPMPVSTPVVARAFSSAITWAGVHVGCSWKTRAPAPVACGVAIEVPLMVLVAVSEVFQVEVMDDPGAKVSTQVPKLENDERASEVVVEPMV